MRDVKFIIITNNNHILKNYQIISLINPTKMILQNHRIVESH